MNKKLLGMILFLLLLVFDFFSLIAKVDLMYLAALNTWVVMVFYCFMNLRRRLLFMLFLVSFFVFLLGGHFCYEYFDLKLNYYFGDSYYFHSNLCLFLSLISLFISYLISEYVLMPHQPDLKPNALTDLYRVVSEETKTKQIRKISVTLFYVTFPFWIYTIADKALFVVNNSYYESYTEYESSAPFAVKAIAAMTPYFMYLFLATMPKKKECIFPLCTYALYGVVSLLTGRRNVFITMFMFIVLYVIMRSFYSKNEVWIQKKYIVAAAVLAPVLLIFLYSFGYSRLARSAKVVSNAEMFLGFFQQQGFSSSVLRLELFYESKLRDDAFYSFYGIVKNFRTNSIIRLLFHPEYGFSYSYNNAALALKGNSLAHALSYYKLSDYTSGHGIGTCYIAELYHDFGYIGIIVGSSIYSFVMTLVNHSWNSYKVKNVWLIAIGFSLVESFIKSPRWNFDIIFSYFLDLGMWMAFSAVFFILLLKRGGQK